MSNTLKKLTNGYMVRVDEETKKSLTKLARELKMPPTTVARMLIEFGLNRKEEFKERVHL